MSQRSQVAKSGSRPIEACSAACRAPRQALRVDPGGVQLVLGDRPPDGPGAQGARRQVELGLAEHLAGDQSAAQEGDDLVGDLDRAEAEAAVAPRRPRRRWSGRRWRWCRGPTSSRAGRRRSTRATESSRSRCCTRYVRPWCRWTAPSWTVVCAAAASTVPSSRPVAGLDDLDRAAAAAADVGEVGGPLAAGPVPAVGRGGAAARAAPAAAAARRLAGPKSSRSSSVSGSLGGGRAQVRGEDVRVVRVEHGGLDGLLEQRLGVVDEVGVQRVVAGDQDGQRALARRGRRGPPAATARPGCRGSRRCSTASRPETSTPSSRAVVAARPRSSAGVQGALQGAALLGQVAAAVGGDAAGRASGRPRRGAPGRSRRPARRRAGTGRRRPCGRPARTRSVSRSAVSAVAVRRTGAPCSPDSSVSGGSHSAKTSSPRGRGVVGDLDDGQAGQAARRPRGLGGGGGGEQEDRVGAVAGAQPAQPAQHLGDVGAEDAAVGVALVDDDVAQGAQEGGPAGVGGQDAAVQHVRIGEDVVGVLAYPLAFLEGRVAVVDGRADRRCPAGRRAPSPSGAGRRPGPWSGRGRARWRRARRMPGPRSPSRSAREDRREVGERLAGGGAGGDDHRLAVHRVLGGARLVGPGVLDAGRPGSRRSTSGRMPVRPDCMAARTWGQVLRMGDARGPVRPPRRAGREPCRGDGRPCCRGCRNGDPGPSAPSVSLA